MLTTETFARGGDLAGRENFPLLRRRLCGSRNGHLVRNAWDWLLVGAALGHGVVLLFWPNWVVVAVGLWWNSNTVAHYFIHRPFFNSRYLNGAFRWYQTAILGVPQTLWRERHVAHHANREWHFAWTQPFVRECILLIVLWVALGMLAPNFLVATYLPGIALGLLLCRLQGYFEHAQGTTSHYGRLYNFLFFNDGFHVEHHARPHAHWRSLRSGRESTLTGSGWPAVLRWLDNVNLVSLEKVVIKFPFLQSWVLRTHKAAFRKILAGLNPTRIVLVGGGLFPRTPLILRELFPSAHITIFERDHAHIEMARRFLDESFEWIEATFNGEGLDCDLLILPLAFQGRVSEVLENRRGLVLVHDWVWNPGERTALVSPFLLKRVNLFGVKGSLVMGKDSALPLALASIMLGIFAKFLVTTGRSFPADFALPAILVWQDITAGILLGLTAWMVRRKSLQRLIYAIFVLFLAFNVPLQKAFSTPLTWNMAGAARGTLVDSIRHQLNPEAVGLLGLMLGAGMLLPMAFHRLSSRVRRGVLGASLLLAIVGFVNGQIDTAGMHRNAALTLLASVVDAVGPSARVLPAATTPLDWRRSPFGSAQQEDLRCFQGAAQGQNIILIALESTGASYLRCYGGGLNPMPNLEKLAAQSLLFENAYAVYPESIKGLFSVLTSRHPAMDVSAAKHASLVSRSIARELRAAGYQTALFHSGRFMYLGMDRIVQASGFDLSEDAGAIGGNHQSSFGVDEPATVARMLAWIDSVPRANPFFLTYLPIAGHHPYDTPEPGPFGTAAEVDRYRNALHYGDKSLGDLIEGLRARQLLERTLFVVFGDHGEAFGQHEGNYGHTLALYEENVHVPLLISIPGVTESQRRIKRVASLVDLAPTLLDLTGIPLKEGFEGNSLLLPEHQMALFFTDYSLRLVGLRDGSWKFQLDLDSRLVKLFHVTTDPGEAHDLSAQETARCDAYKELTTRWVAAQKWKIESSLRAVRTLTSLPQCMVD